MEYGRTEPVLRLVGGVIKARGGPVCLTYTGPSDAPFEEGTIGEEVQRSSLVLQGLTFQPSGAIVAAAPTSLPETMGGDLNWDYRYAWLRDLSLPIRSLYLAACPDEADRLLDWRATSAGTVHDELVQIMYGVEGERDLTEHPRTLAGFRGSIPVRVGNAAWQQEQLDVFGEVFDATYLLKRHARPVRAVGTADVGHARRPGPGMLDGNRRGDVRSP